MSVSDFLLVSFFTGTLSFLSWVDSTRLTVESGLMVLDLMGILDLDSDVKEASFLIEVEEEVVLDGEWAVDLPLA